MGRLYDKEFRSERKDDCIRRLTQSRYIQGAEGGKAFNSTSHRDSLHVTISTALVLKVCSTYR
jgi:hypothetical protein